MTLQTCRYYVVFSSIVSRNLKKTNQTPNMGNVEQNFEKDYINTYLWATLFTLILQIDFVLFFWLVPFRFSIR